MTRTALDVPAVTKWLQETNRPSAAQYAVILRPLLISRDIDSVGPDDLIELVLRQPTETMRRKAVSAFVAFFGDLTESGARARDPAHRLSEKVRIALERRSRRDALKAVGVDDATLAKLKWDTVLAGLIARETSDEPITLPDAPIVRGLEADVLRKLGGISLQRFLRLMRETVL